MVFQGQMLVLVTAFVAASQAHAAVIAVEDFDGGSPAWVNDIEVQQFKDPEPKDSTDGLFIQAASSDNPGFAGNSAFGRDLRGEGDEPSLDPFRFTFANVDVSGFSDVTLSFDFAGRNLFGQRGVYIVVIDGVDQPEVVLYNGTVDTPEVTNPVSSPLIPIADHASTVGLRLEGRLNGPKTIEFDNFRLEGLEALAPEPGGFGLLGLATALTLGRRRRKATGGG